MSSLHQDRLLVEGPETATAAGSPLAPARASSRRPTGEKVSNQVPTQRQGKAQRSGTALADADGIVATPRPRRTSNSLAAAVATAAAGTLAARAKAASSATTRAASAGAATAKAATVKAATAKAATARAATTKAATAAKAAAVAKVAARTAGARSVTAPKTTAAAAKAPGKPAPAAKTAAPATAASVTTSAPAAKPATVAKSATVAKAAPAATAEKPAAAKPTPAAKPATAKATVAAKTSTAVTAAKPATAKATAAAKPATVATHPKAATPKAAPAEPATPKPAAAKPAAAATAAPRPTPYKRTVVEQPAVVADEVVPGSEVTTVAAATEVVASLADGVPSPGRHRRPPVLRRRPALYLAAALVGALGVSVVSTTGPAAQATDMMSSVSVAQELGIDGTTADTVIDPAATERLGELAASRNTRDAEQTAAADVQAKADKAAAAAAAAKAAEAARPKAVLPVAGARISSGFGSRWGTLHAGVDFAAPMDTPEMAVMDGVVLEAGPASGFGLAVYIQHANGDVTVYGHMDKILVQAGQVVKAGETIALLGNRGQSTGPHLHLEVHVGGINGQKIDPLPWLRARGLPV